MPPRRWPSCSSAWQGDLVVLRQRTPLHLSGELFMSMTGIDMLHIPYQNSGPALVDAVSGAAPINFDNPPSRTGFGRTNELRALAVTSKPAP